ncbi:phosphate ABC transporter ATP-binding protein (plasmid) [Mesomycoplasma conjunctivae]|nr:ATP-binding cassette domain-containing protein [Mycoplasmopsis fermentans]ADV34289.1 Oligopeptide ABC transporter ATP-binding protein [Mycoplasmopsis fermentans M64]VEU60314.1 phosphate ABC transporter ATP-binding protein [Mycoplasmopsis fermentans]VEU67455.1 phosphate ABC transporter ATP-binding protein [Mesomycoplasma conjunctivae]
MNKNIVLDIKGLKKYFTNNGITNKAADDITFNVHEGEIVGLIGESGSGKTTVGRSLLRLYDDFNGFVTLDGKIVSGARISRKQRKHLRRNIQMIFQDPHAALNGQKNIYSTLKEPLEVNGIIKERIQDIFKDWFDIKENFFYVFKQRALELKLKNLESINLLAEKFFPYWIEKFKKMNYDQKLDIEDNFNNFYNYLEEKQNMESEIVDNMYSNTDNLINFYFEKQKDYRSGNLDFDETKLIKAKSNYEEILELTKISKQLYEAKLQLAEKSKELKELIKNYKERVNDNKNSFKNFIAEYKSEARIFKVTRLTSYDLDFYLFNYKNELINKKIVKEISLIKPNLKFIEYHKVCDLIEDLKIYSKEFFEKYLTPIKYQRNVIKIVEKTIKDNFKFIYEKYSLLNQQEKDSHEKEVATLKEEIKKIKSLLKEKQEPSKTAEDLEKAKQNLDKVNKFHEEEIAKYVEKNKLEIDEIQRNIKEQSDKYNSLKSQQSITDSEFNRVKDIFFNELNRVIDETKKVNTLENKAKVKELTKIKSIFKTKIYDKLNTLKSFNIEVKYLNKDINDIKKLLGIKNSKMIKVFGNKVGKFIQKHFARFYYHHSISNLLTKTTIYKALEDVGLLKQFAYRYPHEFSGGQRQRIVIARALIIQPKVIVADEPIASLDISIQAQVVNLLKDLCDKKNIGMIFIAHDLSMVEYIADRVQIMHLGKIVESGDTEAVYNKPMHPYTINLFKAVPKISNANEKFENVSFELDYLKGQVYPNVPQLYRVENNHYLYGTESQVEEWVKPFNINSFSLATNKSIDEEYNSKIDHKPYDGHSEIPNNIEYTDEIKIDEPTCEIKISSNFDFSKPIVEVVETKVSTTKTTKKRSTSRKASSAKKTTKK